MKELLLVGIGGGLGAMARYGLSGFAHRVLGASFPYGTLAVNVLGCLVIGAVLYLVEGRAVLSLQARLFLATGILGGLTTFSSFGYETLELLRSQQLRLALLNVAANVVLGLGSVWLGWTGMKLLKL
jgi:CrcB protein